MNLWLIGDTHFGHSMMWEKGHRPPGFSDTIIANWQRLVKPEDTVLHLGDVIMGHETATRLPAIMAQLPGMKILVVGNHDHRSKQWYQDRGFAFVCDSIRRGEILFSHSPFAPLPDGGCRYNIHGHWHKDSSHRRDDDLANPYIAANRHRYVLLEIDSTLSPVLLDDFIANIPKG
jgi:calcineurin-like phosphoesterase family protein